MLAPQQDSVFLWHLATTAGGLCLPVPFSLPPVAVFVYSLPLSPLTDNQCAKRQKTQGDLDHKTFGPFLLRVLLSVVFQLSCVCLTVGLSMTSWN